MTGNDMNNSNVYVKIRDEQVGPYTPVELRKLAKAGEFSENDLVFLEGSEEWVKAGHLPEINDLFTPTVPQERQKTVYAIGGGKGGVGKTMLTASLGIGLASINNQVVIVDADLGGANLHTCMGILEPKFTFYHFYTLQCDSLEEIMLETPVEGLKLISGACGTLGLANPRYLQKLRFISELRRINADFILLDLGAGSSYNVIDFFLTADKGIVVTTPEPMAIQETFNFMKIALLRKLMRTFKSHPEVMAVLERDSYSQTGRMTNTVSTMLSEINTIDSEAGSKVEQILQEFRPQIILNMVHASSEIKEGDALKIAAKELLSIETDYLGYVQYDSSVRKAAKELRPFILDNPKSKPSQDLAKLISVGLLGKSGWQGFQQKRKVTRQLTATSEDYPANSMKESETICSVRCFYWNDCEYQKGGFPCPVRNLDPIFHQ
jgi:flagellar biosynthesis protein FlhG